MRKIVPLMLLVALALTSSIAVADKADKEVAKLKAVDDKFIEAFKKEDVDAIVALYADDAVLMTPGSGMWHRGHAEIRKAFADFLAECDAPTLVLREASYQVHDDLGYCYALCDIAFKDAKTGEMAQMQGRVTSVFAKRSGKWVYVVDHASIPMPSGPEGAAGKPHGHEHSGHQH